MSGPEVLLVSMPWASARRPNLGLSTLAAILQEQGMACSVLYPCIDFAATIGVEAYETLADTPGLFGVCEHIFALQLFVGADLDSQRFLAQYRLRDGSNPFQDIYDRFVDRFIANTVEAIVASGASIVGFGCTFNQTLPSLALAHRLKQLRPDITIIFGGSSMHGPMGEALASTFVHLIDHVFLGEADLTLPLFVQAVRSGASLAAVPGITVNGRPTPPSEPTANLDALPIPHYSDYVSQIGARGLAPDFMEAIPFESSRGCWWGQKNHCTFCGLNSEGMAYRRKSDDRIVREIVALSTTYRSNHLMAADNILPHTAWQKLLPAIAAQGIDLSLFYEIKANLTRDQVRDLRRAGVVCVQPGIESFSTAVLKLMRKGLTGLQNIKFIRLCGEFRLTPSYNILVGFPGETLSDYVAMADLLQRVQHLPAPSGLASLVQIHRFSPFHDKMDEFGFDDVAPASHYRNLIPPAILDPEGYAYFFTRTVPDEVTTHMAVTNAVVSAWMTSDHRIHARLGPGFIEVTDSVRGRIVLDELASVVLLATDDVRSREHLVARLVRHMALTASAAEEAIDSLLARHWLVTDGGHLVSTVPYAEPHSSDDLASWAHRWLPAALMFLRETVIPAMKVMQTP